MRRPPAIYRIAFWLFCLPLVAASWSGINTQGQENGTRAVPSQSLSPPPPPGPQSGAFPAVPVEPASHTPLSGPPYVFTLDRLDQTQMQKQDSAVVSSLDTELSAKAALAGFDLALPGWNYRQVVCPSFPDYLVLDFSQGPDPNGASRFVAVLPRNGRNVRIVTAYAHGMRPFDAAWNKPGTYQVFNGILQQERGFRPLGAAPNWLVIGMCFAELSGDHVQVLTHDQSPEGSLDILRLKGAQPELVIHANRSADLAFSDVSRPGVTTQWTLSFDARGQLTSASRVEEHQPARIALRPAP